MTSQDKLQGIRPPMRHIPGVNVDVLRRAALSQGTRQAEPVALSTLTVTDAMVDAYLEANNAYWHFSDQLPSKPGVWRNGTPREATKVSLEAALAASAPALQAQGEPDMRQILIVQIHNLIDLAERYSRHMHKRGDADERDRIDGEIAHARKVVQPYNCNGPTHERAAPAPEPDPSGMFSKGYAAGRAAATKELADALKASQPVAAEGLVDCGECRTQGCRRGKCRNADQG